MAAPRGARLDLIRLRSRIANSYLTIPLLGVIAAGIAAEFLVRLDTDASDDAFGWAFGGDADAARAILSAIAGATITIAGLVFSITIVALQLTSNQFSPRALSNFLRDRVNQATLAVFLATFTFSLMALRAVRDSGPDGEGLVPDVTITVAFVLMLASVLMFIEFIHHATQSLRAVTIIERIAKETRHSIAQGREEPGTVDVLPTDLTRLLRSDEAVPPGQVGLLRRRGTKPIEDGSVESRRDDSDTRRAPVGLLVASGPGAVTDLDVGNLVALAAERGLTLCLAVRVGDFVPSDGPLLVVRRVIGDPNAPEGLTGVSGDDLHGFEHLIGQDSERSMRQDPAFGFRQLVDIAERALSPGVNDPTTAVQCIDQLHDLLRLAHGSSYPCGGYPDDAGTLRLVIPPWRWPDLLDLALDEVRHWGADSIQVHARLSVLLDDLADLTRRCADDEGLNAVQRHRQLLSARLDDLPSVERQQLARQLATRPSAVAKEGTQVP
ncbi:DUF2254 domain-containing protein [Rhabdothermincola salaria]|uniref:DUF2254 domain-containing protein n=1 Tax=Rhabdothermincola salaria TaxID=2903142 RepID=UPI001E5678CE|nr:DUF2254 domain-containing protein [Rhabdothermincola salaria]MCD9622956.1 DUF2254 domain-containing protein [Rhabdothermincola salaria]